jgi:hypothetical protein
VKMGAYAFLVGCHAIIIDHTPWNRVWINGGFYVYPYAHPWVRVVGPRVERHSFHRCTDASRHESIEAHEKQEPTYSDDQFLTRRVCLH